MVLNHLPFQTWAGFLNWPFFPPFFSFLLALSPGSWRVACKVSSRMQRYKNNPGFIGIATGGVHGGVRVKWLYSTIRLSSQKEPHCYILYLAAAHSHWETEGPLEAQRWERVAVTVNQRMGVLTTRWYLNCSSNNGSLSLQSVPTVCLLMVPVHSLNPAGCRARKY